MPCGEWVLSAKTSHSLSPLNEDEPREHLYSAVRPVRLVGERSSAHYKSRVLDVRDRLSAGKPVFDQELFFNRTEDVFADSAKHLSGVRGGRRGASPAR